MGYARVTLLHVVRIFAGTPWNDVNGVPMDNLLHEHKESAVFWSHAGPLR